MPVTRRVLLAGTAALAATACTGGGRTGAAVPDQGALTDAAKAEEALLAAYDRALAAAGGGSRRGHVAALLTARADHAAHLAVLQRKLSAATSSSVASASTTVTAHDAHALEGAGLPVLVTAAVAAHDAAVAALLGSVAASHAVHVGSATGFPTVPTAVREDAPPMPVAPGELRDLQAALAVEHQVVYGYGLAGAMVQGRDRRLALAALDVHQARRDLLAAVIAAGGGRPTPAAPAYLSPIPLHGPHDAAMLAIRLEDGAAGAAWDLAGASAARDPVRRLALGMLGDAAVRGARWRALAGAPAEPPFPGRR